MSKVYVHARLKLKVGMYEEFCEAIGKQVPVLESHGWKLVGAWTAVVGKVCTVVDLWELPDANTFFDGLAAWRQSENFTEFRKVTSAAILEEDISMMKKVPYSP